MNTLIKVKARIKGTRFIGTCDCCNVDQWVNLFSSNLPTQLCDDCCGGDNDD